MTKGDDIPLNAAGVSYLLFSTQCVCVCPRERDSQSPYDDESVRKCEVTIVSGQLLGRDVHVLAC